MTESTPAAPLDPQHRVAELATGFALNELTDDELRELHRHLIAPDGGREAARTAWRTLDTVTDLRAERSTMLQDTVVAKISETSSGPASGVTGRFLRRLGLRRGSLEPVTVTSTQSAQQRRWLLLIAGVIGLGLAGGTWLAVRPQPVAVVETVSGRVTMGSLGLGPQTAVLAEPVMLAADATVSLRWNHGSHALFTGPGTLVPQTTGLALPHGRALITNLTPFVIGLPDGTLHLSADSEVAIEVVDGHSAIGVLNGRASIDNHELRANQTWSAGISGPWETTPLPSLPARWEPPAIPVWHLWLQLDSGTAGEINLAWSDAQVRILPTGIQVARQGGGSLRTVRPPTPTELHLHATRSGWQLILAGETLLRGDGSPGVIESEKIGNATWSGRLQTGPLRDPH